MDYLGSGFLRALVLLFSGDPETFSAVTTTLEVSSLSILASLALGIPGGFILGYFEFPGKKHLRAVVDTLLALPTVVVGLFVYAFISRRGPFGEMALLFTIPGVALAQTILVLPIVVSLTATAVEGLDRRLRLTLITLGANARQIALQTLLEARFAVLTAAVTAYGRAISEVGISMMIGGNIKWHTRTITTAVALETGKGEFAMGIALGIVLLTLALLVNAVLVTLRRKQ
ncbi:MAG TPA: ABC transporter permease [Syntrophales bacterium]|nr:ABC transporter permease [Syntrophales bacterium]HQB31275.1 ABC transporter permease [Syntrophales bacterium]HQN77766.1 ABC transporter permease [Syntrophales bacterium]HQQ27833.1 ABC transporter permease [Syntrophales bacterium]